MEYKLRKYLEDNWTPEAKGTIAKEDRFVLNLEKPLYGGANSGLQVKEVAVYFKGTSRNPNGGSQYLVLSVGGHNMHFDPDMSVRSLNTIIKNLK